MKYDLIIIDLERRKNTYGCIGCMGEKYVIKYGGNPA